MDTIAAAPACAAIPCLGSTPYRTARQTNRIRGAFIPGPKPRKSPMTQYVAFALLASLALLFGAVVAVYLVVLLAIPVQTEATNESYALRRSARRSGQERG